MDGVYKCSDILRVEIRVDPVPKVSDVPLGAEAGQHLPNELLNLLFAAVHCTGVQVALK